MTASKLHSTRHSLQRVEWSISLSRRFVGSFEVPFGPGFDVVFFADGDFVIGKALELDNFFASTGFLYEIAAGGGAERAMAEWIVDRSPAFRFLHQSPITANAP